MPPDKDVKAAGSSRTSNPYTYVRGGFAWNENTSYWGLKQQRRSFDGAAPTSGDPRWKWFYSYSGYVVIQCTNLNSGPMSMRCGRYTD